jgi:UDP-N-acetyl-D-mannosaminuronate dehydrogenase
MNENGNHVDLVIGLGEIGKPLKEVLEQVYPIIGKDIDPVEISGKIGVLHICYPFQVGDFVETTVNYIKQYQPQLTIVHSTLIPGTMQKVFKRVGGLLAYSPVRGKHTRMREELLHYTKLISGTTPEAGDCGVKYLVGAGFKVRPVSKCESLELAKIVETTYFGLLIAWAQEVERYCSALGANYDEAMMLTEEVNYLPPVVFQPGFIGGHCVMPNIQLLETVYPSPFLDLIKESNEQKKKEWLEQGRNLGERIVPKSNTTEEVNAHVKPAKM